MSTAPARNTYVETGLLAEGGMALVTRATDAQGHDVVIKRIRPPWCFDASFVRLFDDEGTLHAALDHPCVVRMLDRGTDAQGPYLVFEHVDGVDLATLLDDAIARGQGLEPALVVAIAASVCDALDFVHGHARDGQALDVVHRDVSPGNVLLGVDGSVKLADFGVAASRLRTDVTVAGELKGKFAYMAPEQTHGARVTSSADLFALGVVLWECLAGARLFDAATDADVVQAVRHVEAPRLDARHPPVPHALADLVAHLLHKDPAQRPARAAHVAVSLRNLAIELGLDDGMQRVVARAVRQAPRRNVQPIAPDVRRRTQRVVGLVEGAPSSSSPAARVARVIAGTAAVAVLAIGAVALGVQLRRQSIPVAPVVVAPVAVAPVVAPPVVAPPIVAPPVVAPAVVVPAPPRPPWSKTATTPTRGPSAPTGTPSGSRGVGRLSLNSDPWAEVHVDGVLVARETPLVDLPLPAGTHVVELENPVYRLRKRFSVEIPSGGRVRRVVDLASP